MEALALPSEKQTECGTAQTQRLVHNGVEYWRELVTRDVDHLQDPEGRRLVLQGFARLRQETVALHRDYGLRGEILQQRNLLVREGPHLLAVEGKVAQQNTVLAQRGP